MAVSKKPRKARNLITAVEKRYAGGQAILSFLSRGTSVQAPDPTVDMRPLSILMNRYGL